MTSIARPSQTQGGDSSSAPAASNLRFMENAWNLATATVKASGTATQNAAASNTAAQDTATSESVQNAYRDLLGRDADAGGMAYFRDRLVAGATLNEVRAAIAASAEGVAGINAAYQQILGREADAGGLVYFENALAKGVTLADVRAGLAHSDESTQKVNFVFQQMLGRDASPDELDVTSNLASLWEEVGPSLVFAI